MINNRKALVVGINDYPDIPLSGSINDAEQIAELRDMIPHFELRR